MKKPKIILAVFCFAAAVLFLNGCNEKKLQSTWRTQEITIDGSDADWANVTRPMEGANAAIGILNDERNLYLCLIVSDQQLERQIGGLGFTVWFDSAGGDEKRFGVHFPLGFQGRRMNAGQEEQPRTEENGNAPQGEADQRQPGERSFGNQIEILGPGKDDKYQALAPGVQGVEVKVSRSHDNLVYELKVPLAHDRDHDFAIGTDTSKTIGIGFETPEPGAFMRAYRPQGQPEGGEGGGGSGMGGRSGRGGRGGRGGGGMRGAREGGSAPSQFKVWTQLTLAGPSTK